MDRDLHALIRQMTLKEKASLCTGKDFWRLKGVERLKIPSVMVSDGPHGLRRQEDGAANDHLGVNQSIQAVCFPTASATACSFDRDLLRAMGEAMGEECQAVQVAVILGPAVNIKRSPLCGRNFEYFSEDPYLAGELATAQIEGVQSQNIGTSLKHFAVNSQEYHRMTTSAEIDERTLREIYLPAFETAVKRAKPWTVMCSYNRINGVYAAESTWLLTDILRREWGFDGCVVSDWGAVNDGVEGLKAGMDLEMPGSTAYASAQIVRAVHRGALPMKILDQAVERILRVIFRYADNRRECTFDKGKHHALAVYVAQESAVLLKNDDAILPLKENAKVAIIGEFAEKARIQGGGSSRVNAYKVVSALDALGNRPGIAYAAGYPSDRDERIEEWEEEALEAARNADIAVLFAGLPDVFESEGYDRPHMRLPACQTHLIEAVLEVQPNAVIVLHDGSPVEMPWADRAKAILEMHLSGQGVGEAAVNLLYGRVNPSGKLAESIPIKLSDNPSHLCFPGDGEVLEYREGVFVGYRYYEKKEMAVRFPFGHGLSYTAFAYSNLALDKESMRDTDQLMVSVDITNIGDTTGKEIAQLYVADRTGTAVRPIKEMKGFEKIELAPGETKTVCFALEGRSFMWYNTKISDWYCASGEYEILIGASSADIRLIKSVYVESTKELPFEVTINSRLDQLMKRPRIRKIVKGTAFRLFPAPEAQQPTYDVTEKMMRHSLMESPMRSLRTFARLPQSLINLILSIVRWLGR